MPDNQPFLSNVHLCFTSAGLDELPERKQRNLIDVARVLAKTKRFSVFEATANQVIAHTMDRICKSGWFTVEPSEYPWTHVKLTPEGRKVLYRRKCK